MIRALSQASHWKFILPVFIVFAIFSFYIFPEYQARMVAAAGEQVTPIDTRFSYSPAEVRDLFDTLKEDGRAIYRTVVSPIDMIYPLVYGLLFVLILAWLLKKLTHPGSTWILLALLPLLGITFDYLENFNTIKMLDQYPEISPDTVVWGEGVSLAKHSIGILSVALAFVLSIALLIKKLKGRRRAASSLN